MSVTAFQRRRRMIAKAKMEVEKRGREAKQGNTEGQEAQEKSTSAAQLTLKDLRQEAQERGIEGYSQMKKQELIDALFSLEEHGDEPAGA